MSARNSNSQLPLLLLDVDGVVSPSEGEHKGPLPDVWPRWERAPSVRVPVYFAPELVARLTALPIEPHLVLDLGGPATVSGVVEINLHVRLPRPEAQMVRLSYDGTPESWLVLELPGLEITHEPDDARIYS